MYTLFFSIWYVDWKAIMEFAHLIFIKWWLNSFRVIVSIFLMNERHEEGQVNDNPDTKELL